MSERHAHNQLAKVSLLVIHRSLLQQIEERILAEHHTEACGFLAGWFEGCQAVAVEAFFATNLSNLPDCFVISPREHQQVLERLRDGRKILRLFHSHRKNPHPSPKDEDNMKLLPFIWMIFGQTEARCLEDIETMAFKSIKGKPEQIQIRIQSSGL